MKSLIQSLTSTFRTRLISLLAGTDIQVVMNVSINTERSSVHIEGDKPYIIENCFIDCWTDSNRKLWPDNYSSVCISNAFTTGESLQMGKR